MLMIDKPMPEGCDVCPLMYDYIRCNALPEGDEHEDAFHDWNFDYTKRPDWCPLKEQQQIVLCKDCVHLIHNPGFMNDGYCKYFKIKPDNDFYCGAGRR